MHPVFFYDFASPESYLAAERVNSTLPVVPEWTPVRGLQLGDRQELDLAAYEYRAEEQGVQPLRWPRHNPIESETALLAATYAKEIGRAVAFSLAAFRQAYAGGADLSQPENVFIAAAACELHPNAIARALGMESIAERLQNATDTAKNQGITELPAIVVDGEIFTGPAAVENAAEALNRTKDPESLLSSSDGKRNSGNRHGQK
jgi:2-hydroxychromene-2-carboxylate isomerase